MASVMSSPVPAATPATVGEALVEGFETATESTGQFLASLPLITTRLLLAAVAILIGYLLLRLGRMLLGRLIRSKAGSSFQQRETFRSLVESVFSYVMYFIIATVVLSIFGVNISSILAVAGVGGVAIGFGAQTLVKDVISGVFLWAEGNVTVGDTVTVNGMTGTVEAVALRTTTVRDFNGNLYIVPNGDIRTVVNMSRGFKRALVEVRLNYEEDLEYMLGILRDEMAACRETVPGLREEPIVQGVNAMAGDCISVQIAALCEPGQVYGVERALRLRIKARFDREGILFPHGPIMATPRRDA